MEEHVSQVTLWLNHIFGPLALRDWRAPAQDERSLHACRKMGRLLLCRQELNATMHTGRGVMLAVTFRVVGVRERAPGHHST